MNWNNLPKIPFLSSPSLSLPKLPFGAADPETAPESGKKLWFYEVKSGWRLFDAQQQADLDVNAQSGATLFQIDIKGTAYEINLTSWKQINAANRTKTRKIKQDFPNGAVGNPTKQFAVPLSSIRQPPHFANTTTIHQTTAGNASTVVANTPATKWMYHGQGGWYFYDDVSHSTIESHYAKGAAFCEIRIGSVGYQINFKTMKQTNLMNTTKERHIKRGTSNNDEALNSVATLIFNIWHYFWHPLTAVSELYSKAIYIFEELKRKRHM